MINRQLFVPAELRTDPRFNEALAMPSGDYTISQLTLVESMVEELEVSPGMRILEVGGGTGFHAACIAEKGAHVVSIDRLPHAVEIAKQNLAAAGVSNVEMVFGDGFAGFPERAPFDRISVACAVGGFPHKLFEQLAVGGILLYPAGIPTTDTRYPEILLRVEKLREVGETQNAAALRAAMKIEQLMPVYFIRGESPQLPESVSATTFGRAHFSGCVFEYEAERPEIGFVESNVRQNSGPPLHYHLNEDEGFTVLEGSFDFRIGERSAHLKKGDWVLARRGEPHSFCATGNGDNRLLITFSPAGGERYFLEMDELERRGARNRESFQAVNKKYGMVLLEASKRDRDAD